MYRGPRTLGAPDLTASGSEKKVSAAFCHLQQVLPGYMPGHMSYIYTYMDVCVVTLPMTHTSLLADCSSTSVVYVWCLAGIETCTFCIQWFFLFTCACHYFIALFATHENHLDPKTDSVLHSVPCLPVVSR